MSTDFYHTERWKRLRRAILQRDEWKCQFALANGKNEPAVTVHHIFPLSEYPEYKWEPWNLISLSWSAHNMMHQRDTDKLTERGELLRKQTATERGIDTEKKTTLVMGMPNTGKTTYVKKHMKRGVCYDLDAIAAALRLTEPKAETYKPARWIANKLLKGFADAAHQYVNDVWIIRTAPTLDELFEIDPTDLVIIYGEYGNESISDERRSEIAQRIKQAVDWAKHNGIKVKEIEK